MVLTLFATAAVAAPRTDHTKEPPLTTKILNKVRYLIQSLEGGYISPPRP
ncbi:MAG TPA: hypothetical protein VEU30_05155 [Thermoanaerobaculia bacterium]|nr:hypothetical protein [Thermoanaerobaculia bacterium]